MKTDNLFTESESVRLAEKRLQSRSVMSRITFDCLNAFYHHKAHKVLCKENHPVGLNGQGGKLKAVLSGYCLAGCKDCQDFNPEVGIDIEGGATANRSMKN